MSSLIYVLIGIAGGAVAVALIDRVRACSLLNKAKGELAKAEKAIEEKRKEFELEKKEQLHQLKVKFEQETEERRKEFREFGGFGSLLARVRKRKKKALFEGTGDRGGEKKA